MQILNYTGLYVGLTNIAGQPTRILPPQGRARMEIDGTDFKQTVDGVPIYKVNHKRIKGLPEPDPNNERFYIISKEVASYISKRRYDLLVAEEPFQWAGDTFYRRLVSVSTSQKG
ncbi:hypothetical protein DYU05_20575 [Mucilaginibacter terrenus]|uniref:Uncharacterized protein n=1 Tax=Mucilaginibacter terrenus TaxID=2482727 RepID=A0A3E2NJJ5_9SPHI|nr:hypothetical protein [Mucilaginibacter terrenus]RFZ81155.1 hypothetical protein DYU05_20575 [Mucilaginibacter terrenus]